MSRLIKRHERFELPEIVAVMREGGHIQTAPGDARLYWLYKAPKNGKSVVTADVTQRRFDQLVKEFGLALRDTPPEIAASLRSFGSWSGPPKQVYLLAPRRAAVPARRKAGV